MTPPVFSHGSLRLYLLMLLAERPRHGYELIQALSDRFGGTYVPSAGTIYTRLAKLEEEGLVSKENDGRKTIYAITDAGRAELAARDGELNSIEDEVTDSVRRLANEVRAGVNQAMKSLRADLASAARDGRRGATERDHNGWSSTTSGFSSDEKAPAGEPSGANPSTGPATPGSTDAGGPSVGFTEAKGTNGPNARAAESNSAVHDADVALTTFRQQLRTELRKRSVRGQVPRSAVELLEQRLREVRTEVLAALDTPH